MPCISQNIIFTNQLIIKWWKKSFNLKIVLFHNRKIASSQFIKNCIFRLLTATALFVLKSHQPNVMKAY